MRLLTLGGSPFGLSQVLTDLNSGKPPTEDELDYIMAVADQAESNNQMRAKKVYRNQLMAAVDAWKTYKDNEGTINEYFERYDVNNSGSLGKKQLCQVCRTGWMNAFFTGFAPLFSCQAVQTISQSRFGPEKRGCVQTN